MHNSDKINDCVSDLAAQRGIKIPEPHCARTAAAAAAAAVQSRCRCSYAVAGAAIKM